jgi:hypothetical protein
MPRIGPKNWVIIIGLTVIFILILEWVQGRSGMAQAASDQSQNAAEEITVINIDAL